VKENLNAEKKVTKITVMVKVAGFAPEAGDWYWAACGPDGKTLVQGKVDG